MRFSEQYGPWALITGASEGTGASFARRLASYGVNCILIARREGPLNELAREIQDIHGVDCATGSIDLSSHDAIQQIIDVTGNREVGLLVTNAGADCNGNTFLDLNIEAWQELVTLNVTTTMGLCHYFGQRMRDRRRGGILLVGSGACYGGMAGIPVYSGSKAFDLCFAEGLWAELKPYGIDVLNLVLGRTDTPAHRDLMARLGVPMPSGLASSDEVAQLGLSRLPHGPVHNWGLADDEEGYGYASAATRRQRILNLADASPATKQSSIQSRS